MRERKEIMSEFAKNAPVGHYWAEKGFLEVLLDIRDLLQNPPIEITGEFTK